MYGDINSMRECMNMRKIIPETIMLNDMHRYPLNKLQGELDPILKSLYSIIEVFINKNMLHHI